MQQLTKHQSVVDEDQLIDLVDQITSLVLDLTDPGSLSK